MEKIDVRAVFSKSGRAIFISHLDLQRTMQRALKRSGLPVWYSQGFNPHIYLNFPLALSLGISSCTEFMDFSVTEEIDFEKAREKLDLAMPDGISVIKLAEPVHKNQDIGFAEYEMKFYGGSPDEMLEGLEKMMSMETIETEKHSKSKGIVKIDIRPHIEILNAEACGDHLFLTVKLPAGGSLNINANVFADAFSDVSGIEFKSICIERTKILCKNGEKFI